MVAFLSLIMSDRNFHNSYENQTQKILKSVFVTNFLEDSSARDLRKVCSDYGTVVDVFIPFKISKSGKPFAFVRFIKEFDFGMSLMGRAKDVSAIPNIPCIISKEGFQNVKLSYLIGMWVLFEFNSLASKEKFLNHSGLGNKAKRRWIKGLCQKHRITFAYIQETKAESISLHTIKDLWRNQMFVHVVGSSVGCSGAILCMWNPNMFVKEQVSTCDYFVALMGTWAPTSSKLLIISIYAPQELNERRDLWDYLHTFIDRWEGNTVIMGDFNEELNNRNAIEISQKTKSDGPLKVKKTPNIYMQFSHIQAPSICFDFTFPTRLSSYQVQDLKRTVTYEEEVKRAIWDCGTNKSPRPNGFSFEFYCKHWTTIDDDVFQAVRDFFVNGHFPRGCNSSFIALIPKIQDAKFVKDFCSISLIGSVYKIIVKILANRLCVVLPYLISDVQSAFVANRQILDGPFILNELLSWYKTIKAFGFGSKWRNWISSCLDNAMGSVLVNGSPTLEFQFHKGLKQGIGVSSNVIAAATSLIGCSILTAPFNYLGVKVGSNMSRITSYRKLAWIGWNMVLTSKKNGDLGVSSFFAHNRSLVFKWVWRFLTDGSSLWTHFINAIFGNKGALDTHKLIPRRSPWQDVILAIHSLQSKGEVALKVLYIMLYSLEMCKSISVAEKMGHPSLSHSFRRMPRGSQKFSVKSSCNLINNTILPKAEVPTRWLIVIPIKVNVHAWRVCLDKLPTIANLSLRGMDIPSIACPLCNSAIESSSYIFSLVPCLAKFGENFDLVGT
nr:RNA-directed DNA polymerase, eukaryota [Tanacetum cinerariifolium]